MGDPRWLRFITIGLILAALAVGYFLLSGKFLSGGPIKNSAQTNKPVTDTSQSAVPTPASSPTPTSAYARVAGRSQSDVNILPKTAFPVGFGITFSAAAIAVGWGLRKFPH